MKFAHSSAAILLFVALAHCMSHIPTAVKRDDGDTLPSVAQKSFPTVIQLSDGSSVNETCTSFSFVDNNTGEAIITTACSPGAQDGNESMNSAATDGSDGNNNASDDSDDGSDSGFGVRDAGVGAFISARGSSSAAELGKGRSQASTKKRSSMPKLPGSNRKGKRIVVTSNQVMTPDGAVSENCQIQLIPQSDGLYMEVQTCEVSIESNASVSAPDTQSDPSPEPDVSPQAISASSITSDATPIASTSFSPSSSPVSSPAGSTSVFSFPTSPTPLASLNPSSDPASPGPESSLSAANGAFIIGTGVTTLQIPSPSPLVSALSSDGNNTTNGTIVADNAATFTMPGRKLSVLPVGLAVFAGVSVIALIVVGVVTYERTKYRKNFRRRQLAEQMKARTDQMSEHYMV